MAKIDALQDFVDYCHKHIKGDEKGEAQTFLEHFFIAFSWPGGHKEAGVTLEFRVKDTRKHTTSFDDLVWPKTVLIEMKRRDENLAIHVQQATDYWFYLTDP